MLAKAFIKSKNLVNNIDVIRKLFPKAQYCYMIKANGYGHGAENIASIIEKNTPNNQTSQTVFAVCEIKKAIALKHSNPSRKILLLHGVNSPQ